MKYGAPPLVVLALLSTLAGCSGDPEATTGATAATGSGGGSSSSSGAGGGGGGSGGEGGGSTCQPGATELCYTGPAGTEILGACKAGIATCKADGSGFGPCEGEVVPATESCATPSDDDCDGQVNEEGCACVPGESAACYSAPMSTKDVGICHAGTQTCNPDGLAFGPCIGEVTPATETCATPEDDDCDGQVNEEGVACACVPNSAAPCYTGPAGTQDIGTCKSGVTACNAQGTAYGPCVGEVLPLPETCATPADDDCDGQINEEGASCVCVPNTLAPCYSGPAGTQDVGACKGGNKACNAQGTAYGPCVGEIVPAAETCNTPVDDDCDGQINENGAGCLCVPNAAVSCYSGPPGSAGVGICKTGTAMCNAQGTAVGPCQGEVTPLPEDCANPADEDCNGVADTCGTFGWSKSFGDPLDQDALDVAADAAGNVYVTGFFEGTVDFGAGPVTSAGATDIFIIKYSPAGAPLWVKTFGNSSNQQGSSIAVDAVGNVYVTGFFGNTLDFGGGPLTSAGGHDIFILKLSSAGNHVLSKRAGGPLDDEGAAIGVDAAGNIAVTGTHKSPVDFGGGPLASQGNDDIFVAKLTAAGGHVFTKSYGDPGNQDTRDLAVDAAGNIIITGFFESTIDFGAGPITANGNDILLAKLSPAGALVFGKSFPAPGSNIGNSVAADSAGNILLTGYSQASIDFGGGALPGVSGNEAFVVKLDATGGHIWSKGFAGVGEQLGLGVAVDPAGNVIATGRLAGAVNFGGGPLTPAGANDIYLAKLDPAGAHVWSMIFGDSLEQLGRAVAADGSGVISLVGRYQGTVNFGGGLLTSAGGYDAFVAHFAP